MRHRLNMVGNLHGPELADWTLVEARGVSADGALSSQDFIDFLTAFFAGCP
jgi:hypothetical protein